MTSLHPRHHLPRTAIALACSLALHTGFATAADASAAATGAAMAAADASPKLAPVTIESKSTPAAKARDEQREADVVSNVMSRDQIDNAPVGNVADVAKRIPGLSAYSDNQLGQAATGESQRLTIRGLDASYNVYRLDGQRLPSSDPTTRAISLNMLAPFGLESIRVVKTPGADIDGDSIGGVIDFRTPTAFDFSGPLTRATVQGNWSQLASDRGVSAGGGLAQVEVARRFGDSDRIGVYGTLYYGKKHTAAEATSPNNDWKPTNADEASITDLSKVSSLSNQQFKFDFYDSEIERYGGNLALDWKGDATSLYLKANVSRYTTTGSDNQVSFRSGQVVGAIGQTSINPGGGDYDASGTYAPYGVLRGGYFQTRDMQESLSTLTAGGSTQLDRVKLDYSASYGYGAQHRPDFYEASLYGTPVPGYLRFDLSDPRVPVPIASSAIKNSLYSLDTDSLWKLQGHDAGSSDHTVSAKLDASYAWRPQSTLQGGIGFEQSKRNSFDHPFTHDDNNFVVNGSYFGGSNAPFYAPAGPSLSTLPGQLLSDPFGGNYAGPFKLIDRSALAPLIVPFKYVNDPTGAGTYTANDYNANTSFGTERVYSVYGMATLKDDALTVVPGLRYEYTDYAAAHWVGNGDDATGAFQSDGKRYGTVLPSINLSWRSSDDVVLRAAARRGLSRPAFGLLSGPTSISIDDTSGQIQSISKANPDLSPTTSTNLDASAEFYQGDDGILSVGGYYKRIHHFIYTSLSGTGASNNLGGSAPTQTSTQNGVDITQPENGGDASLYGLEFEGRRRLAELPGLWSGLGVGGNLTLQHSRADSLRADHFGRKTWLPRAPREIANVELFYEHAGWRAALDYNYTGLQLVTLTSNNLDHYLQPTRTLDLSVGYTVSGSSVSLAVHNLTNQATFYETEGKSTRYLANEGGGNGSYINTGRMLLATASYAF